MILEGTAVARSFGGLRVLSRVDFAVAENADGLVVPGVGAFAACIRIRTLFCAIIVA